MDASQLTNLPLFAGLREQDRAKIARWADEVDVPEGKHLVDQGRFAYEFFVILQGTADVLKDGELLTSLGPGDTFGEIGLLGSERLRTATVVATSPLRVLVMLERDFDAMERTMPEVAAQVQAICAERTRGALAD